MDEFGFGKWESTDDSFIKSLDKPLTKNEKLSIEKDSVDFRKEKNEKKRYWKDVLNAQISHRKRKKELGMAELDSEDSDNFDNEYGIENFMHTKHRKKHKKNDNETNENNIDKNTTNDIKNMDERSDDNLDTYHKIKFKQRQMKDAQFETQVFILSFFCFFFVFLNHMHVHCLILCVCVCVCVCWLCVILFGFCGYYVHMTQKKDKLPNMGLQKKKP